MADASFKIVVAEPLSDSAMGRMRSAGEVVELASCDPATLLAAVHDCSALVVRSYADVTDAVFRAAAKLKVVGRAGVGVENIDLAAAARAGVVVVHTPAASTQAVAELVIGFIIELERRVHWAQQELRQEAFMSARRRLAGRQLGEMTLGIIGFGRIGRLLGEIAHRAFAMRVVFNDIRDIEHDTAVAKKASKDDIYTSADVISLHVPLTDQTRHLIGATALGKMKKSTLLINTSRGDVVDATALAHALSSGELAGAAIDVFDTEPPPADHPLLAAPNCILTPHIGSRTRSSLAAMNDVVDDVIAVLQGRPPRHPCNDGSELS